MSGIIRKIRCLLLTSTWVLTLPIGFLIGWIPALYSRYERLRLGLLRRLDPTEECWLLSYLERRQRIAEQYSLYIINNNATEHINQLVREIGLCPEVILRCATIAEMYIRRQQWQEAEEILYKGYQLAYEWYRQPIRQRCRSLFDRYLVLSVATSILVALWVFKKCREEGKEPGLDPSYDGWLLKLAFGSGVNKDTFWRVWYPQAQKHFTNLTLGEHFNN